MRRFSTKLFKNPLKPFNGRVQYISDIHLDRNPFDRYPIMPAANDDKRMPTVPPELLVVAGDLGNPFSQNFIDCLAENCDHFPQVVFVPGNHEYYHPDHCYQTIQDQLRKIEQKIDNLHILMKDSLTIKFNNDRFGQAETLRILGCTLWSHIPAQYIERFQRGFGDYHRISWKNNAKFTPLITNQLHREELDWLTHEIKNSDQSCLVVTHHAPLLKGTCHPKYLGQAKNSDNINRSRWYNYAFSTDLSHLMGSHVTAWIFGHTHYRVCFQPDQIETVLAQNHLGYTQKPHQTIRTL